MFSSLDLDHVYSSCFSNHHFIYIILQLWHWQQNTNILKVGFWVLYLTGLYTSLALPPSIISKYQSCPACQTSIGQVSEIKSLAAAAKQVIEKYREAKKAVGV